MSLRALRTIALAATCTATALPTTAPAAVMFNDWTSVNTAMGNHQLTVIDTGKEFEWKLTITPWNAEITPPPSPSIPPTSRVPVAPTLALVLAGAAALGVRRRRIG